MLSYLHSIYSNIQRDCDANIYQNETQKEKEDLEHSLIKPEFRRCCLDHSNLYARAASDTIQLMEDRYFV